MGRTVDRQAVDFLILRQAGEMSGIVPLNQIWPDYCRDQVTPLAENRPFVKDSLLAGTMIAEIWSKTRQTSRQRRWTHTAPVARGIGDSPQRFTASMYLS
jgi:hypothetical protein